MGIDSASTRRGVNGMTDKIEIRYYDASGKQHDAAALIDQADLFRFVCAMVSPGLVYDWWEQYPVESLPSGGLQPESVEEAEQFMRHTRDLAIEIGLWSAL